MPDDKICYINLGLLIGGSLTYVPHRGIELNFNKVLYNLDDIFQISVKEVIYRQSTDFIGKARIYQPVGDGPFPCILDVHGGVWNGGSLSDNARMDQILAKSGIVVVAIDYRLAPSHPYPAQVQDVNYATRWVKSQAGLLNIDNSSIGALGASSGGHTVMLNAMRPNDPRYSALDLEVSAEYDASLSYVVAMWPVLDGYSRYLYAVENELDHIKLCSERYFLTQDAMQEGNPQSLLDNNESVVLPPVLIIHGTDDLNVPLSIPQKFFDSYRRSGGDARLELFPSMPHGFGNRDSTESDRALKIVKAFVQDRVSDKHLKTT